MSNHNNTAIESSRPARAPRRRLFTLDHANRALPLVRRIVVDIVEQYRIVAALEEQCQAPRPDIAGEALEELRDQYERQLRRFSAFVDELEEIGCELKDWRRGLVDFRGLHHGREVEFCWKLGEDQILHWHEVNAGFRSRRPIEPTPAQSAEPVS